MDTRRSKVLLAAILILVSSFTILAGSVQSEDGYGDEKRFIVKESTDPSTENESDRYPLPEDYWDSELKNAEFKFGFHDIPTFAYLGEDIPVKVKNCRIIEHYPDQETYWANSTTNVTFSLLNGTEKITEVSGVHVGKGTFEAIIPGSATDDLAPGAYTVKIIGKAPHCLPKKITNAIFFIGHKDLTRVEELQVTPGHGRVPLDIRIKARSMNPSNHSVDIPIKIDGSKIKNFTLAPDEEREITVNFTLEKAGTYTVDVGRSTEDVLGRSMSVTAAKPKPEFELTKHLQTSKNKREITVTATVKNTGSKEETIHIWAGGTEIASKSIGSGENHTFEVTHEFDSEGEYKVELGASLNDTLDRTSVDLEKGGDTPGFMLFFLVISVLAAAVIYRKKS